MENIRSLLKNLEIWRSYQNIITATAILVNETFIIPYSMISKHPTQNLTPQSQSNRHDLLFRTRKCLKSLKEIIRKHYKMLDKFRE